VTASVLLEAFVVGAIASGIGLGLGVALAGGLRSLLVAFGLDFPSSGTVVKSTSLLIAGSAGMAVTMISAILPARRAARVAPVAALTESEIDSSATSGRRTVAGIVITGLAFASIVTGVFTGVGNGLQLVGLGMPLAFVGVAVLGPVLARPVLNVLGAPLPRLRGTTGALAQRNALRNPRRTAATAAALTIGVGLVGLITIMADSTKASIGQIVDVVFQGDFVVLTDAFDFAGGLPIELADELRALPESDQVVVVRGTVAELEGSAGFVPGVDTVNADGLLDPGIIEGSWEGLGPGTIALHHEEAASLGVGIGDHVTLRFVDTGEQQLAVAMIYEDETILEEQFVPLTVFEANVVDQRDIQLLVNVAPGIDPDVAREALVGVTERYPNAMVKDRSEFKEVFASQINQLLALVFVMLALAIVIAIIGIANTLALSILERTRELGVLRAVGMTRSQLRSAVRYESVLVSLLGATLGLVLGVAFGVVLMTALRDDGLKVLSIPLGQLTLIVVVAAVCGVGASVAPARRAARLDVLDAVTAE
jgi:putative ABC transport system permease protein